MGELHDWQVARHLEREFVAFFAFGSGGGQRRLLHVLGYPGHLRCCGVEAEGVGRIQRVFAEFLPQGCLLVLDGGKALALGACQIRTPKDEVANGVFMGLALLGIERLDVDGLVFCKQALVGTQAGPEVGHGRQHGVVRRPQLRCVGHTLEVADGAPGDAQLLGGDVQFTGYGLPLRGKLRGCHGFEGFTGFCQQGFDGGGHMFRENLVEQRQWGGTQQWVHGAIRQGVR